MVSSVPNNEWELNCIQVQLEAKYLLKDPFDFCIIVSVDAMCIVKVHLNLT